MQRNRPQFLGDHMQYRQVFIGIALSLGALQYGCATPTQDETLGFAGAAGDGAAPSGVGGQPSATATSKPSDADAYSPKAATTTKDWGCDQSGSCGADVVLESSATHICALTRVQGELKSSRVVRVWIGADGFWRLGGSSNSGNSLSGSARCWPFTDFTGPGSNVKWISPQFATYDNTCGVNPTPVSAWQSDAAAMISGVRGTFNASAERVFITQNIGAGVYNQLTAEGGGCAVTAGEAYSFFVGQPGSGQIAKFIGPNGTGNASVSGEWTRNSDQGSLNMANVSDAMCYLTVVRGEFSGAGEKVEIIEAAGKWQLRVTNGGDKTWGSARCFKFNQL